MAQARLESGVFGEGRVVPFTWLARDLSIKAEEAKRQLAKFAKDHGNAVSVWYLVSGTGASDDPNRSHLVQVVPKDKLDGECQRAAYQQRSEQPLPWPFPTQPGSLFALLPF